MRKYNWQLPDWPNFTYDLSLLEDKLIAIAQKTGIISGKLSHLSNNLQTETAVSIMVEEAAKTSEIEGEYLSRLDIRSSIINCLKPHPNTLKISDKLAKGVAELMMDVRNTFNDPITAEKLFEWHITLLAASPNYHLKIGCWRSQTDPMQVVSGHHDKWVVHYEAPPAKNVAAEMGNFIQWFNNTQPGAPKAIKFPTIRAAIAHLYFESIHPFEDGNGRIGRAIAEKALSQGLGYPSILSLSQAIDMNKKLYYAALNKASYTNQITEWIDYFTNLILTAQEQTEQQINFIIKKAKFFDKFKNQLNDRQLKVIQRMLEAGTDGFEGGMSAKKYMILTKTSKATATRDLQTLYTLGALSQIGQGRSIRYELQLSNLG